jgi:hypothetical protein
MWSWSFLTNHARVLLCIAAGVRLGDIVASLGITDRSARGIVTDLTAARARPRESERPLAAPGKIPLPPTRTDAGQNW